MHSRVLRLPSPAAAAPGRSSGQTSRSRAACEELCFCFPYSRLLWLAVLGAKGEPGRVNHPPADECPWRAHRLGGKATGGCAQASRPQEACAAFLVRSPARQLSPPGPCPYSHAAARAPLGRCSRPCGTRRKWCAGDGRVPACRDCGLQFCWFTCRAAQLTDVAHMLQTRWL